jgi:hypothetical protein
MKRVYIVGLCLMAAMALSALASASASAAEYGQCQALGKHTSPKAKHGKYENSGCTVEQAKHKGNFEWVPGPSPTCVAQKKGEYTESACATKSAKAHKGTFEKECPVNCANISASGGEAFLEAESGLKIECKTNGAEDSHIVSASEARGIAKYTGCEIKTAHAVCTSSGAASGEIKTYELSAKPVEISGAVWVEYSAGPGDTNPPYLAEFACAGAANIRVKGTADGKVSGGVNEMSVNTEQVFSTALKNQNLTSESNIGKGYEKPEKSFQNQTTKFTTEDPAGGEIRT